MPKPKKQSQLLQDTFRNQRLHLKQVKRKNKFQAFNHVALKETSFNVKRETKIIESYRFELYDFFKELDFIHPGEGSQYVIIPKEFCFCSNYEESIKIIKAFASGIFDFLGYEITLDFTHCHKVDTAALFVMQIVRLELLEKLRPLQKKLQILNVTPEVRVISSNNKDVRRLLIISGYPVDGKSEAELEGDSSLKPLDSMGYLKGSKNQRHYNENKKSIYTYKLVKYIDACLEKHGYMFTDLERNNFEGIISEVLSNAEDHSVFNNWFVTANFSKEEIGDNQDDLVGEVNLTIMNFGNSLYQGFLATKELNHAMFLTVAKHVSELLQRYPRCDFSEEQLFTLAMMQDQISRLKYERASRGTGTMTFIRSFLELGDFENKSKGYIPNLSLFTGHTQLICDNKYKPFLKQNLYCLSLNDKKDLSVPPENTHLVKLGDRFPGTLLSVKIYLNKKHMDVKYGGLYE